jgi:hypothetical protein
MNSCHFGVHRRARPQTRARPTAERSNRSLVPWRYPSQMVNNPNSKRVSMECYSVSPVTQVERGSIRVRPTPRARGHGPNRADCETTLG